MEFGQGISRRGNAILVFWMTVIMAVVCDQATKVAVCHALPLGSPRRVLIPGLIDLLHVENTGAAFSIGRGHTLFFIVTASLAFLLCFWMVFREDLPMRLVVTLACVAGGGLGNMVDRIIKGSVTDFLATSFIDFPVFNVADIFVTCGIAACVVLFMRMEQGDTRSEGEGSVSHG